VKQEASFTVPLETSLLINNVSTRKRKRICAFSSYAVFYKNTSTARNVVFAQQATPVKHNGNSAVGRILTYRHVLKMLKFVRKVTYKMYNTEHMFLIIYSTHYSFTKIPNTK